MVLFIVVCVSSLIMNLIYMRFPLFSVCFPKLSPVLWCFRLYNGVSRPVISVVCKKKTLVLFFGKLALVS
jgi:hypothetical protein